MIVYRWEDGEGIGMFRAGITEYLSETDSDLWEDWLCYVHNPLPTPVQEHWVTTEREYVPFMWDYFAHLGIDKKTLKYAFESIEQCRKFISEDWDEILIEFGCNLVTYRITDLDTVLVGTCQVVFIDECAELEEVIL